MPSDSPGTTVPPTTPPASPPHQTDVEAIIRRTVAETQRHNPPQNPPRADDSEQSPPSGGRRTTEQTTSELRAEAAAWRVQLRQAQADLADANTKLAESQAAVEAAKTTAVGPLQTKLDRAMARVSSTSVQAAMIAAGLQDPDLIPIFEKMPNAPKITVNDDFEVEGVKEFVEAAKKHKPDYFKTPGSGGGDGKSASQKRPAGDTSRGAEPAPSDKPAVVNVRDMSKADYEKFKRDQLNGFRRVAR